MLLLFFLDYTFPFYSSNSPKNGNVNAMTKKPGDIIILHEGTKNHDQKLCCSWNITRVRCNCYCSFWAIFNPFTTLTAPKHENLKKKKRKKNALKYNNFTQVYQKSWSYAILFLRYMVRDGFNCYFSFWTIFCPFTALTARKIKVWIKKKRPGGITNSHKCTKNHDHMLYCSRDLWCMMDGIVIFDFWLSFAHLTL